VVDLGIDAGNQRLGESDGDPRRTELGADGTLCITDHEPISSAHWLRCRDRPHEIVQRSINIRSKNGELLQVGVPEANIHGLGLQVIIPADRDLGTGTEWICSEPSRRKHIGGGNG